MCSGSTLYHYVAGDDSSNPPETELESVLPLRRNLPLWEIHQAISTATDHKLLSFDMFGTHLIPLPSYRRAQ